MTVDVEALERRVAALESDARGEAALTRRLFEHVSEIRDDIAVLRKHAAASGDTLEQLKARLSRLEERFGRLEGRFDKLESRLDRQETEFAAFRKELPGQIADVMREVLRESR